VSRAALVHAQMELQTAEAEVASLLNEMSGPHLLAFNRASLEAQVASLHRELRLIRSALSRIQRVLGGTN
jgi:multidrug resistance efflux pump